MRILWIVNTIFPEPSKALGLSAPVSGGWMYSSAKQLSKAREVKLAIATTYSGTELKLLSIEGIDYYLLPCKNKIKYDTKLEQHWEKVCAQFLPDLVHIHGTEYAHGLACMRKIPSLRYVISIQGLVSIIARTYFAGIGVFEIIKNITIRDVLLFDTIFHQKIRFIRRGIFEQQYIKTTKHVIGRTDWDYAQTKAINPFVKYHFCNDILRYSFYNSSKWDLNIKNENTIFLSQAAYPIKGIHQVIKAIFLLKNDFPNIKLRVAGLNIFETVNLISKIKLTGYALYVRKLIKKYELKNMIEFVGSLSEQEMCQEYLNSHIFISPSSIENGGNSLGEAQLLGVPVIASYVGGIPDSIINNISGLFYPFEEVEMLAENIRKIFTDAKLAKSLSENGIIAAEKRHDQIVNLQQTIYIYNTIIKQE